MNDTAVELLLDRLPVHGRSGGTDLVSIADVGFGVSQTLPVLVALRAATKRNLVYIEQPEIHLHPRAQLALADILADAARRGVRMVIETHSALLLLRLQTLMATGTLAPDEIRLLWFVRDDRGMTRVSEGEPGAVQAWLATGGDVDPAINFER